MGMFASWPLLPAIKCPAAEWVISATQKPQPQHEQVQAA
jgi:hypothetical protein